jgi:hypothetical protein
LDSVLKETLKKAMSALKAIKEQWDSGDAGKSTSFSHSFLTWASLLKPAHPLIGLIDDILQIIDTPADVKMEVTAS